MPRAVVTGIVLVSHAMTVVLVVAKSVVAIVALLKAAVTTAKKRVGWWREHKYLLCH